MLFFFYCEIKAVQNLTLAFITPVYDPSDWSVILLFCVPQDEDEDDEEEEEEAEKTEAPVLLGRGQRNAILDSRTRVRTWASLRVVRSLMF